MADEPKTRPLKGWRTVIVNVLVIAGAAATYLAHDSGAAIKSLISDPEHAALAISAVSVLNILLRAFTTTPIGSRE